MRETRTSGSVRGASGDGRPYRERQGRRHLPVSVWREATAIPDLARPIVGPPGRLCPS